MLSTPIPELAMLVLPTARRARTPASLPVPGPLPCWLVRRATLDTLHDPPTEIATHAHPTACRVLITDLAPGVFETGVRLATSSKYLTEHATRAQVTASRATTTRTATIFVRPAR